MQITNQHWAIKLLLCIGILLIGLSSCKKIYIDEPGAQNQTPTVKTTILPTEIVDSSAFTLYEAGEYLNIHEIQGEGHNSLYSRSNVKNVAGVVTVKRADGFYMQSPVPDQKDETSEGIFVFLNKPPKLDVGDLVFVDGKINEMYSDNAESGYLSITQIENPTYLVLSKNNELPEPIIIGDGGRIPPANIIDDDARKNYEMTDGLDFYESLEGMLVQINDAIVVGPTTQYKEIVVLADFGKHATGLNQRGGLTISVNDYNPERLILDDSLASLPELRVGERINDPIIGIVDYTFGNFKIQSLRRVKGNGIGVNPEVADKKKESELSIATYNVENLGANDSEQRFEILASQIVNNLGAPDIIALQEIQDNDGALGSSDSSADITYQKIVDAVLSAGGPRYKAIDINPSPEKDGGEPGGNIRVGFLYREDSGLRLGDYPVGDYDDSIEINSINGQIEMNRNPVRIDPLNYAFLNSRKPLLIEFLYNGKKLFIINNHWNSKGGDTPLFGAVQPPRLESEAQRKKQAQVIANFVSELLTHDPDGLILVLGDLNDFYFSEPLKILENSGMTNLFNLLDETDRYTYIYDGNSQALDNVLATSTLMEFVISIDVVHINSEFPSRENFSDHDPIITRFDFSK